MAVILPVLSLLLFIPVIQRFGSYGWRVSTLFAFVIWGTIIAGMTEILSLFHWINFYSILVTWLIILVILLFLSIFSIRSARPYPVRRSLALIQDFEFFLLAGVLLIVIFVGLIAFLYPPNNIDSMTYHMSRVMHWIQNQSVEFYPTANLRQLHQSPWAEFAILHLQILNDGDLFANSIQWLCMIGYIVGVTLIAQELGASTRGQIFSAAICATIPMGIIQGSTTQTDGAVTLWLVCFVFFVMQLRKKPNFFFALGAGLALGLGVLTKATTYIYAFPFLIWLVVSLFKNKAPKKWQILALIAIIPLVLNAGAYLRNYELYRHPLGPRQEAVWGTYANQLFSPASFTSNVVRNISIHFSTPVIQINHYLERIVVLIHKLINLSPNDPRTTWWKVTFAIPIFSPQEDSAGNLVNLFLISALLIFFVVQKPRDRAVGVYILLVLSAFFLFCGYLKWQPWNSRLQLPLFVLFAPFLGLVLARIPASKIAVFIFLILLVGSVPFLFTDKMRPLIGNDIEISYAIEDREEQYFNNHPEMAKGFIGAAKVLHSLDCSNIGMIIGADDYEYPVWVLLRMNTNHPIRIEHVNVTNVSKRLESRSKPAEYCALFNIIPKDLKLPDEISVGNTVYSRYWSSEKKAFGNVNIYTP